MKGQKQRTKINSSFSAFVEILFGVLQGSILGPLLFNIYICDLLFENGDIDIANYANDNVPYACSSDLDSVIFKLQKNTERIFRQFYYNNSMSHSQKSAAFRFDKSAKNVKNSGSKNGKKPFWFAKSITKVQENNGLQYKIST